MDVHQIFTTPVASFKIENSDDLNKGLCDYILNLKREDNPQKSMVGGYHTKEDILKDDNKFVQEFRNIIQYNAESYYGKKFGTNTKMSAWGMIYEPGNSYSKPHGHAYTDLSSAYYCKVPNDMIGGDLSFMDPRPAAKMDMKFADESILNIKPVERQGLIFPGWLEHYVEPHKSSDYRICITTNFFIDHGTFFK